MQAENSAMAMPTEAELRELLRPSAVEDALTCLWISAGLIGLIAGLKLLGVFGPLRPAPVIGEALGGLVMLTFFAIMIGGGRTWARWLFGAVYAIAAVSFLIALLRAPGVFFSAPIVLQLAVLAHFALQGAALVLVFAPSSREWFRSSGRAKKEVPAGKTYRIYAHPARTAPIAVKVGFCWPAFVVGPLWFLLNRMFVNFLIVTAFVVGAHLFFSYSVRGAWQGAMALLYYATALCIGLIGNPLLAAELLGDGYVLRSTVRASSFSKATDLALREEQPDGVPAS